MAVTVEILTNVKRPDGTFVQRYRCESGDTKPDDAALNEECIELDTGDTYYFDGSAWTEVGSNA